MSWDPERCDAVNVGGMPRDGNRPAAIDERGNHLDGNLRVVGPEFREETEVGQTFDDDEGYLFYSDNPETVWQDKPNLPKGRGPVLSMATFRQAAQVRVYAYHLAKGAQRHFWLGVMNNDSAVTLQVTGRRIVPKPEADVTLASGAEMAALSLQGTGNEETNLALRQALSLAEKPGKGWVVVADVVRNAGRLWHGVYDLLIESSGNHNFVVATYTGPGSPAPAQFPTWEHWPDTPTGRKKLREGLFKNAHTKLRVPASDYLQLGSDAQYFYVSTLTHSDPRPTGQLEGRNFVRAKGSTLDYEDTGNYGYWVDVELHVQNPGAEATVDLWVDAVRYWEDVGGRLGYTGAVQLQSSTPAVHTKMVPGAAPVLIPTIFLSPDAGEYNSAYLDSFTLGAGQSVIRVYRFMHGAGSSLPFCIWLDPRPGATRRPKPS